MTVKVSSIRLAIEGLPDDDTVVLSQHFEGDAGELVDITLQAIQQRDGRCLIAIDVEERPFDDMDDEDEDDDYDDCFDDDGDQWYDDDCCDDDLFNDRS